jgi:hypothetical protein
MLEKLKIGFIAAITWLVTLVFIGAVAKICWFFMKIGWDLL